MEAVKMRDTGILLSPPATPPLQDPTGKDPKVRICSGTNSRVQRQVVKQSSTPEITAMVPTNGVILNFPQLIRASEP